MMLRICLGVVLGLFLCLNPVSAEEGFAPAPDAVQPLLVGQQLAPLTLTDADGNPFDLNAQNKKKPLVVVFYRGHW